MFKTIIGWISGYTLSCIIVDLLINILKNKAKKNNIKFKLKNEKLIKPLLYPFIMTLMVLILVLFTSIEVSPPQTVSSVPVLTINNIVELNEFINSIYSNELAMKKQYEGKTIKLASGLVNRVGNSLSGPYVEFRYRNPDSTLVSCYFSESQSSNLAELKQFSKISIIGSCGWFGTSLYLTNSVIVE